MAIPSIYLNLEDSVEDIAARLQRQNLPQVVLVCPKRCFLFQDAENLKRLKAYADALGKEVFILTMDERGRGYAREAGLPLKFLPGNHPSKVLSDVQMAPKKTLATEAPKKEDLGRFSATVKEIKYIARKFVPAAILSDTVKQEDTDSPPQEQLANTANEQEPVEVTETFFPAEIQDEYKDQADKSYARKVVAGIVAVSLILFLLLVFVILPKATVAVYPKVEPVTRDMQISLSGNTQSIDLDKLILPASRIDEVLSVNNKFESLGKQQIGNKASGTVQIYNFTKQPINLKASTTVLSAGGKTYTLVSDVEGLKPAVYKNAKTKEVDENSLSGSLEIVATSGGDDFNLPEGTRLEITNQIFGSKPQFLYAKTDSEISGGTTRYLSVISQDDASSSQIQLRDQILQQLRQKLELRGLVLADGAYVVNVTQFNTDNPVGSQTPNFQASLKAEVIGLAFRQVDLTNLIMQRIDETLPSNKTLKPGQPDQSSYIISGLDLNNLLAVMQLHFQGQAQFDVDLQNIAPQLVGKSKEDANEILRSRSEIDKIDIFLAPAWQKNFPLFASKIKINLAESN